MKENKNTKYSTFSLNKITAPKGKPKDEPKSKKNESGKDMRCGGK